MTGAANTRTGLLLAAGLLVTSVAAFLALGSWRDDAPPPPPDGERHQERGATSPRDAAGGRAGSAAKEPPEPTGAATNDAPRDDAVRREDAPRERTPTSLTVQLRDADSGEELHDYLVAIVRVGALDTLAEPITWRPTDARGEARRLDLEPGRYAIQLARRGRLPNVDLLAGDARREVIELPAGGAIVGTVLRPDGEPAAGAEVFSADETLPEPVVARTGADGRFELRHCRPLRLRARLAGHAPSDALVAAPADGEDALVTLQLGAASRRLTGVVYDEHARPLAGATIAVLRPDAREADRLWLRADEHGRFATDELVAAGYVVFASDRARQHLPAHVAADVRDGDADVVLRCPTPSHLFGRVRTRRAQGLHVLTTRRGTGHVARLHDLATREHVPVAADGTFSLRVPAGDVIARVARDGRVVARTELEVAAGERREWSPEVSDGTPLRVEVASWTALPPELRVVVPNPTNPWMPTKSALDEHGAAELVLDGHEPFDLDLVLELPDGRSMTLLQRRAVPRDQRTLRLELLRPQLPVTHVTGRLVDPDRRPLADRELLITREDGDMELWIRFHSGADGAFSVGPLPPGTYAIETYELQDPERWQQIAVPGGKRLELGDLVADPD